MNDVVKRVPLLFFIPYLNSVRKQCYIDFKRTLSVIRI
jgi:hypothetical protein